MMLTEKQLTARINLILCAPSFFKQDTKLEILPYQVRLFENTFNRKKPFVYRLFYELKGVKRSVFVHVSKPVTKRHEITLIRLLMRRSGLKPYSVKAAA